MDLRLSWTRSMLDVKRLTRSNNTRDFLLWIFDTGFKSNKIEQNRTLNQNELCSLCATRWTSETQMSLALFTREKILFYRKRFPIVYLYTRSLMTNILANKLSFKLLWRDNTVYILQKFHQNHKPDRKFSCHDKESERREVKTRSRELPYEITIENNDIKQARWVRILRGNWLCSLDSKWRDGKHVCFNNGGDGGKDNNNNKMTDRRESLYRNSRVNMTWEVRRRILKQVLERSLVQSWKASEFRSRYYRTHGRTLKCLTGELCFCNIYHHSVSLRNLRDPLRPKKIVKSRPVMSIQCLMLILKWHVSERAQFV